MIKINSVNNSGLKIIFVSTSKKTTLLPTPLKKKKKRAEISVSCIGFLLGTFQSKINEDPIRSGKKVN